MAKAVKWSSLHLDWLTERVEKRINEGPPLSRRTLHALLEGEKGPDCYERTAGALGFYPQRPNPDPEVKEVRG